jgi:hypothetical protein
MAEIICEITIEFIGAEHLKTLKAVHYAGQLFCDTLSQLKTSQCLVEELFGFARRLGIADDQEDLERQIIRSENYKATGNLVRGDARTR